MQTIILFLDGHDFETLKLSEQIKASLNDKATFLQLNLTMHPASFATFKVEELPTAVAFLNGKELWRVSGSFSEETILKHFETVLP
jgi:thioredoxin-like negative regulator of GroEL